MDARIACRFAAAACIAIAANASAQPFHNNYPHPSKARFWAWKWEQIRDGTPGAPPGGWKFPSLKPDAAALRVNTTEATVTWVGHACFLVQLAGTNILFDAQFSPRASPVAFAGPPRIVPLPIGIAELPRIDAVMISHNHYDHLDVDSVKRLAARAGGSPRFLVPMGLAKWFRAIGMHWGTFADLTDEPMDEPPVRLARGREARGLAVEQFDVMKIGETRKMARCAPKTPSSC